MNERHYRGTYHDTPMKPCPFCGSDAILTIYGDGFASVKCSGENGCIICPSTHPHCPAPEAAIYDWNVRGKVVYLVNRLGLEVPFAVLGSEEEAKRYVAEAVESFPDMVLNNYDPEGEEVR